MAAEKNEENSPYIQGILGFDNTDAAISTGNAFADMLTGQIASYYQVNQKVKYYNRYKVVEPYFQDDWHVTKRLTLNLGLRMSMFGTYHEKYHQAYNFDPAAYQAFHGAATRYRRIGYRTVRRHYPQYRQSLRRHRAVRRGRRSGAVA